MARRAPARRNPTPAQQVLDVPGTTVLDVMDTLLNTGVMATGDVTLGVAGVDLIYLRLSSLLCAADRVLPPAPQSRPRTRRIGARRGRR